MPATNNPIENTHQALEAYPTFKRRMMSARGAQRVLDFRVFGHNRALFSREIARVEARLSRLAHYSTEKMWDSSLRGGPRHFRAELKKVRAAQAKYETFWQDYFAKI